MRYATGEASLQARKDRRTIPGVLENLSRAGRQGGYTEKTTALGLVVPVTVRMLHMVQVAPLLLISGLVMVVVAYRMIGVGQAVDSVLGGSECDRDWRCNKGKNRCGGDPDRYSKQRPSHQRRQHALPVCGCCRESLVPWFGRGKRWIFTHFVSQHKHSRLWPVRHKRPVGRRAA